MGILDELVISGLSFLAGFGARDLLADARVMLRKRQEARDSRGENSEHRE